MDKGNNILILLLLFVIFYQILYTFCYIVVFTPFCNLVQYFASSCPVNRFETSVGNDSIFDVVSKLEGYSHAPSLNLIKHDLKFKRKGVLSEYSHHHVPLLPNEYLKVFTKNIETITQQIDPETNTVSLDRVEQEINKIGKRKGGRLTGHWLITKDIDGEKFYLGVFPHGYKNYDDNWIKKQLIESERLLRQ